VASVGSREGAAAVGIEAGVEAAMVVKVGGGVELVG